LLERSTLGTSPPGHWDVPQPGVDGTTDQNVTDPNWIWRLTAPTTLSGPMTIQWWTSCGACGPGFGNADWTIRLWADGTKVFEQVVHAIPNQPNIPSLLTTTIELPTVNANTKFVLQIDPVFLGTQAQTHIYYDSQSPCLGVSGASCDSQVTMPVAAPTSSATPMSARSLNTGSTQDDVLQAVSCTSASNCWAVGYYFSATGNYQTLIEHWDGTAWAIVTSPNTSPTDNDNLYKVTCASALECWAVGFYQNLTSGLYQTLIEQWNGTSWTIVASPNTTDVTGAMEHDVLYGVACASASDCWAVGVSYSRTTGGPYQTLTEHWNGTSWLVVASADTPPPVRDNQLYGVTCASPTECWAVGFSETSEPFVSIPRQTLIEQWNGTSWSIVTSPDANTNSVNYLFSAACTSASDCWAVGWNYNAQGIAQALFERWNGSSWAIVTSPITAGHFDALYDVTCVAASECWAVGQYFIGDSAYHTLIEQWDGTSWALVSSPNTNPAQTNELLGVACASASDCWAVGFYVNDSGVAQTLTEHYTVSPPIPTSVVSRKTHGTAGDFDIDLPITGNPGIECRSGGASNDYQVVVTFPNSVTFINAAITSGTGTVANTNGSGTPAVTLNLAGVTNAQTITLTLSAVNDGTSVGDVGVRMGVLVGDVNASGVVTTGDTNLCKAQALQPVTNANFRNDINASGDITTGDVNLIKQNALSQLPSPP
jgi:hypothetical protein